MYFTNDGFVISGIEIFWIIIAIPTIVAMLQLFGRVSRYIAARWTSKSEDYPGSIKFQDIHEEYKSDVNRFSDVADAYDENDLDKKRRERVIFEEIISNAIFRYDEKTKMLTIGDRSASSDAQPIKMKLSGIDDLRDFVDRLEDYVNE